MNTKYNSGTASFIKSLDAQRIANADPIERALFGLAANGDKQADDMLKSKKLGKFKKQMEQLGERHKPPTELMKRVFFIMAKVKFGVPGSGS